jgi:hypothetical protein
VQNANHYRANEPRFVDETVDGESLIMDMVRGNYYSCVGASAVAWNALKAGAAVAEVVDLIVASYDTDGQDVRGHVDEFVAALLADELLVQTDDARDAGSRPVPLTETAAGTPRAYSGLQLERYSDLADLILLDPVHDVSEAGWPHRED